MSALAVAEPRVPKDVEAARIRVGMFDPPSPWETLRAIMLWADGIRPMHKRDEALLAALERAQDWAHAGAQLAIEYHDYQRRPNNNLSAEWSRVAVFFSGARCMLSYRRAKARPRAWGSA